MCSIGPLPVGMRVRERGFSSSVFLPASDSPILRPSERRTCRGKRRFQRPREEEGPNYKLASLCSVVACMTGVCSRRTILCTRLDPATISRVAVPLIRHARETRIDREVGDALSPAAFQLERKCTVPGGVGGAHSLFIMRGCAGFFPLSPGSSARIRRQAMNMISQVGRKVFGMQFRKDEMPSVITILCSCRGTVPKGRCFLSAMVSCIKVSN